MQNVIRRLGILVVYLWAAQLLAQDPIRLTRDKSGDFRPFKIVEGSLIEFVKEYSRWMSQPILFEENASEVKGRVTLFARHSLKPQDLSEIFHRVLSDNGYAIVDASSGNGWVIQRQRDARDAALPVFEFSKLPHSNRLVTAFRDLQFADSESVARILRIVVSAHSRVIPATKSQLIFTDSALNIRRLDKLISALDTSEALEREESRKSKPPAKICEQRIEKLVVENLEIQNEGGEAHGGLKAGRGR